jgi:HK97 family phage prohead protease
MRQPPNYASFAPADDHCSDDVRKIDEYAHKVTASASDAQLLIATVNREAERLVGQYWELIEWFSRVLERLGDDLDHDLLQKLLPIVKPAQREVIRHRRCFISSDWQRRGLSRPNGFDPETREINAVLSTGARVRRQDWDGAAVLDAHDWTSGMSSVLGGIVPGSARLDNGSLIARIKFSRGSPLAQRIAQDLQDGIQVSLSVGYKIHRSEIDRSTNPETRTATDWEPLEVSLVPISAEETGTGFRVAA